VLTAVGLPARSSVRSCRRSPWSVVPAVPFWYAHRAPLARASTVRLQPARPGCVPAARTRARRSGPAAPTAPRTPPPTATPADAWPCVVPPRLLKLACQEGTDTSQRLRPARPVALVEGPEPGTTSFS